MIERPMDHAEGLRIIMDERRIYCKEKPQGNRFHEMIIKENSNYPRVVAVTSGKGGVGKTNVVTNLAYELSLMGKRVIILDADMGLANVDVLLGLCPEFHIGHVLSGKKRLRDILLKGPGGFLVIPASSGIQDLVQLNESQRIHLIEELNSISRDMDLLIIDTSAGISSNVTYFSLFAHDIIVLSSSEPTSITDAYALMKLLFIRYGERSFKLLVNAIQDSNEAMEVYRILKRVGERFLNLSIDYLGYVLMDDNLPRAVKRQRLMTELYPNSKASLCFKRIALKIGEYS